jgi:hypothetical protein
MLTAIATAGLAIVVAHGDWRVSIDASEPANLGYQLDCLSGAMRQCSRDAFLALWKNRLGWSEEDQKSLERWSAVRAHYDRSFALGDDFTAPFPETPSLLSLHDKVRIAFLQSADRAALDHDLRLVVSPSDADALLALYDRFAKRFHPWFAGAAKKQLAVFGSRFAGLLRRRSVMDHFNASARLYGVPRGPHAVHVHLIAHPATEGSTNGGQIEDHAVVECLDGEDPRERIDVVLHEIFHFMYRLATQTHAAVERAFLDSTDPRALAVYGIVDEALATVLGNALVTKLLVSLDEYRTRIANPLNLYADAFIGPVAKQLLPIVERRLSTGKPLDAAFVAEAVTAAREALGTRIDSPLLALRTMAIAWDGDPLRPAGVVLVRAIRPRVSLDGSPLADDKTIADFGDHARLSGAVLVLKSQLAHLTAWSSVLGKDAQTILADRARRTPAFVQPFARPGGATIWVFVAEDTTSLETLVADFAKDGAK